MPDMEKDRRSFPGPGNYKLSPVNKYGNRDNDTVEKAGVQMKDNIEAAFIKNQANKYLTTRDSII
jgi:hypothetical protein